MRKSLAVLDTDTLYDFRARYVKHSAFLTDAGESAGNVLLVDVQLVVRDRIVRFVADHLWIPMKPVILGHLVSLRLHPGEWFRFSAFPHAYRRGYKEHKGASDFTLRNPRGVRSDDLFEANYEKYY